MSAIPKWFLRRMQILESLKFAPASMQLHWLALSDVTDGELQRAVERAARECDEFPSPKMLRAFIPPKPLAAPVDDPARETPVERKTFTLPDGTTLPVTREWKYFCDDCNDSGWLNHFCGTDQPTKPWLSRRTCDRKYDHPSHEWVRLCPCATRNPDVPPAVKQRALAAAKEVA